ncbi:MAG TPA: adenylate/guanylate cyclase domain-containing protein [Usitatibacter sp.]|jgi:adenylate cyclase|nr:adenylate/guanylate cyclase domain-containing protein [Usitatibacter sp.]
MRSIRSLLQQKVSLNTVARIGMGLIVACIFVAIEGGSYQFDPMQRLENQAYDARVKLFMPHTVDPRIVIVDIDEKTLIKEGRWPLSRDKWVALVHQLFERYRIRVMGFDVAFPEPDTSSGLPILERLAQGELRNDESYRAFLEKNRTALDFDKLFAEEIAKYPVVLGFFLSPKQERAGVLPLPIYDVSSLGGKDDRYRYTLATGYSGNIPELQKVAAAAGHLAPSLDADGVTRRIPMFTRLDNGLYEAMSLAVTRMYLGNSPLKVRTDSVGSGAQKVNWITEIDVAGHKIPLDDGMAALVPFRGPHHTFRYVSATDVIRGVLPADDLVDKIAIVGTSAQGLLDIRTTPVGEDYPGVEIHANMVSGILDGSIKQRPPEADGINIVTLLLLGLPLAFFLPRMTALGSTLITVAALALVFTVNLFAWQKGYIFSIASPALMVVLLYFLNMAYGFFMEARSRQLITGLFGTYVPKELVAEMAKNPEEYSMRGESRVMTVLFSDVRDFTSISEGLTAEQLKDMMNTYLTAMTEVIQEKRGTIDKYIGDAIMAFWGAPVGDTDHAVHGLEAALDMQRRIRALDDEFIKQGWPLLNIGVGLNCGEMNVGDMGSRFRRAYTVMGDAVNIASRLESLTKEYGVGILVSANMVEAAGGFVYREVDRVVVKGRQEGLAIYEPLGRMGEVGETTLQEVDRFHKALDLYRKQRWEDAEAILKTLSFAAPESKLYKLYLKRIQHFRASTPGPAWNGLWVFTTK